MKCYEAATCFFLIHLIQIITSQDTAYRLTVHTSSWIIAGTDNDLGFQIIGKQGSRQVTTSWQRVSAGGGKFERGDYDTVVMRGPKLDVITDIQVRIYKGSKRRVDWWCLSWIKMESDDGTQYKFFFDKKLKSQYRTYNSESMILENCPDGYFGKRNKCEDRDECSYTCKGDQNVCENYPGGFSCNCKQGYKPIGDHCEDVNECEQNICSPYSNTVCRNLEGSYSCTCMKGYEGSKESCSDVDECKKPSSNKCQQKCINKNGGYECACERGFRLAPNGLGCIDADECENNPCNTTTSTCYNIKGNFICRCNNGYEHENQKSNNSPANIGSDDCSPRKCYPLYLSDPMVVTSPSNCLIKGAKRYGDKCQFDCRPGYKLARESSPEFVCNTDGIWVPTQKEKFSPRCVPLVCPRIESLKNAYLVPASCDRNGITHGRSCSYYCDSGYKLVGNRTFQCQMGKMVDYEKPYCVRIPRISCPDDVKVTLPILKNTVQLGANYVGARSNLPDSNIRSEPSNVGSYYKFPLGRTVVKMIARNRLGDEDSCFYRVTVEDRSPPFVQFCPDDLSYVLDSGKDVYVEWKEPEFVDNVKIKSIHSSVPNKKMYPPQSFQVYYNALDVNGNQAVCEFTVNIKVLDCSKENFEGGDQTALLACAGSFCFASCPPGKIFHNITTKFGMRNGWFCSSGKLRGITRIPDCVDEVQKNDEKCPAGSQETLNSQNQSLKTICALCPRGTKFDSNSKSCVDCPFNTYQDEEGKLECKKCPTGSGTRGKRNIFRESCEALCPLGFHSRSGFIDKRRGGCMPCGRAEYNDKFGATSCQKCPTRTLTQGIGSISAYDCLPIPKCVVIYPSSQIKTVEGEDVSFTCAFQSVGEGIASTLDFKVDWKNDTSKDSISQSIELGIKGMRITGVHYKITNADVSDSGDYVCEAVLKDGSRETTTATVVVEPADGGSGAPSDEFFIE